MTRVPRETRNACFFPSLLLGLNYYGLWRRQWLALRASQWLKNDYLAAIGTYLVRISTAARFQRSAVGNVSLIRTDVPELAMTVDLAWTHIVQVALASTH